MNRTSPTQNFDIYMAGDIIIARQVCREFCMELGFCVTIAPVDYIYTGGEEAGFRIGIINYPRFPAIGEALLSRARRLAELLIDRCCQNSYTIIGPSETEWFSRKER